MILIIGIYIISLYILSTLIVAFSQEIFRPADYTLIFQRPDDKSNLEVSRFLNVAEDDLYALGIEVEIRTGLGISTPSIRIINQNRRRELLSLSGDNAEDLATLNKIKHEVDMFNFILEAVHHPVDNATPLSIIRYNSEFHHYHYFVNKYKKFTIYVIPNYYDATPEVNKVRFKQHIDEFKEYRGQMGSTSNDRLFIYVQDTPENKPFLAMIGWHGLKNNNPGIISPIIHLERKIDL